MKTKKYLVPAVAAFVVVVGFLVAAHLKATINNPPIAQASSEHKPGISEENQPLEKTLPEHKITDRTSFLQGVFFARKVIGNIKIEELSLGLHNQDDPKKYLKSLPAVEVSVEQIKPEVEKYGLTQQLLQTETELRLRQHGIIIGMSTSPEMEKEFEGLEKITNDNISQIWLQAYNAESDQAFLELASTGIRISEFSYPFLFSLFEQPPTLYVNVHAAISKETHYAAFAIHLELKDAANLFRNGAGCTAAIWEEDGVAGCSSSRLKDYVRECLRDMLDRFINDYLAANPKDR